MVLYNNADYSILCSTSITPKDYPVATDYVFMIRTRDISSELPHMVD